MKNLIKKIYFEFQKFFHFGFYSICLICENEINKESHFCINCFQDLNFINHYCQKCGGQIHSLFSKYNLEICFQCLIGKNTIIKHIDSSRSLLIYKNNSKTAKLILKLKASDEEYFFDKISQMIISKFFKYIIEFNIICSVPSHFKRFFLKGFNTSELLADSIFRNIKKIHQNSDIKLINRILKKIKNNKRQINQNFSERIKNNKGVFEFNQRFFSKQIILGKKILIIDDVFTSGSTLNECAKVLKQNGAGFVGSLTIGKTDLNQ